MNLLPALKYQTVMWVFWGLSLYALITNGSNLFFWGSQAGFFVVLGLGILSRKRHDKKYEELSEAISWYYEDWYRHNGTD